MNIKKSSLLLCAVSAFFAAGAQSAFAVDPNGVPALEDYPDVFDGFQSQSFSGAGSSMMGNGDAPAKPPKPMILEARVYAQLNGKTELISKNDFALRQGQAQTAEKIVSANCVKIAPDTTSSTTPMEPNQPMPADTKPVIERVQEGLRLGVLWTATNGNKQYLTVAYKLKNLTQVQGGNRFSYNNSPNGAVAAELMSIALDNDSSPRVVSVAKSDGGGQWALVIGAPESFARMDMQQGAIRPFALTP